jgi:hypothetical protein
MANSVTKPMREIKGGGRKEARRQETGVRRQKLV